MGINTQAMASQGMNLDGTPISTPSVTKAAANPTNSATASDTGEKLLGDFQEFSSTLVQVNPIGLESLNKESAYTSRSKSSGGYTIYDVVHDYSWTSTPQSYRSDKGLYSDVPRIHLYEFEQDLNTFYASLLMWFRSAEEAIKSIGDGVSPYIGLYHAKTTNTQFILPYFNQFVTSQTQQWKKSEGIFEIEALAKLKNLISNVAMGMNAAPGVAINQPHTWEGCTPVSYPVTFELFNTVGSMSDTVNNMQYNLALINRLRMSTLHDQRNIILASPPALFEIVIPGIRMSPAAVIGNITVDNVGQMNYINGKNIPDAYRVTLNITELIAESRQILNASVGGGSKVTSSIRAIRDTSATKNVVGGG